MAAAAVSLSGCAFGFPKAPTYLTDRNVTLNGTVYSDRPQDNVTYRFEYGTTTSYGSSTPTRILDYATASGTGDVTEPIGGLAPDTIYHFRICGFDQQAGTCGADYTIRTKPAGGRSGIAFESTRDGNLEVYAMNANGTGQTRLTTNAAADGQPAFSSDGTKIAFRSNRDGDNDIYVMNTDGTGVTQLTNSPGDDLWPAWQPGGPFTQRILFFSDRDGNPEIYSMSTDGSDQRREVFNAAADTVPAWSPEGVWLAFASTRTGNSEVHLMTLPPSGFFPFAIGSNPALDADPRFSPDAENIAFHSNRNGSFEIFRMGARGQSPTRLTNNDFGDFTPAWSPDGAKIAFASTREGTSKIFSMNPDGSVQVRLSPAGSTFADAHATWSPRWP